MALSVAVVGSGPSGFYLAEALLEIAPEARIDILDRLPAPFGLVRFGVAPDHQGSKKIVKRFERTALRPGVRFQGNIEVGRDVSLAELRNAYDAVVLASGAALDRPLEIPGEDKSGIIGSAAFVGWYNAHPDFRHLDPDLNTSAVAVIGNGNVAIDCARILVKTRSELAESDLPAHVLEHLQAAPIRDVYLFGRRGPVEAAFTTKELLELGELERAVPLIENATIPDSVDGEFTEKVKRVKEKNLEAMRSYVSNKPGDKERRVHLYFHAAPVEVLGGAKVEGLRLERTKVVDGRARGTGEFFEILCGLIVSCIGYRSAPLDGVPYDKKAGTMANEDGRIEPGLYTVGWAKRGPTGVISTNYPDGVTVAAHIKADCGEVGKAGPQTLDRLIAERNLRPVSFADWRKIEAAENAAAIPPAPRRKFPTIDEMLAALG